MYITDNFTTLDSGIGVTPGTNVALLLKFSHHDFNTFLHQSRHCGHFLFKLFQKLISVALLFFIFYLLICIQSTERLRNNFCRYLSLHLFSSLWIESNQLQWLLFIPFFFHFQLLNGNGFEENREIAIFVIKIQGPHSPKVHWIGWILQ